MHVQLCAAMVSLGFASYFFVVYDNLKSDSQASDSQQFDGLVSATQAIDSQISERQAKLLPGMR